MTAGYIVESSSAMELDERDGLLYFSSKATLFPTRRKAQRAINNTVGERPTFEKEFARLRIVRIVTLATK